MQLKATKSDQDTVRNYKKIKTSKKIWKYHVWNWQEAAEGKLMICNKEAKGPHTHMKDIR